MAERTGSTGLAFILGAVVVAVAVLGYFVLGGEAPSDGPKLEIQVDK